MVDRVPPFSDEIVSLREAMDRVFGESAFSPFRGMWSGSWGNSAGRLTLPLDVYATKDDVVIIAALPGIEADQIEIAVDQHMVTLRGRVPNVASSEEAKEATWYVHELQHGVFQRTITLPVEVDPARADATCEHGILRLRLPKAEAARPRQIRVRIAGSGATSGESSEP